LNEGYVTDSYIIQQAAGLFRSFKMLTQKHLYFTMEHESVFIVFKDATSFGPVYGASSRDTNI
jgi:hypothetical protein